MKLILVMVLLNTVDLRYVPTCIQATYASCLFLLICFSLSEALEVLSMKVGEIQRLHHLHLSSTYKCSYRIAGSFRREFIFEYFV